MLTTYLLEVGSTLTRVSTDALGTSEPSAADTRRRFSPVSTKEGNVPVLYAAEGLMCALGETVFHDLDDDSFVPQEVLRSDLLTLRAGTLNVVRALLLGDLRDPALASYGVAREQVIATRPQDYPVTRRWAQHAWDAGDLDGIGWNSRRTPEGLSFMLFMPASGSRGVRRSRDLDVAGPPLALFDGPGLGQVMTAASQRNVTVVIP